MDRTDRAPSAGLEDLVRGIVREEIAAYDKRVAESYNQYRADLKDLIARGGTPSSHYTGNLKVENGWIKVDTDLKRSVRPPIG